MSDKLMIEELESIAREMYEDGTYYAEHYSREIWKSRGWPDVDDETIYKILDAYIKFLRSLNEYYGTDRESDKFGHTGVFGKIPPRDW